MKKHILLTLLAALMIAGTAFAVTNDSAVTVAPEDVTETAIIVQEETVPEEAQAEGAENTEVELTVEQAQDGTLEVVKVENAEK